jgi:MtN3 and saliva related transmembrane protein
MQTTVELVGAVAAALTTGAFAPQVWRSWRTRSVRDLSGAMLVAMGAGNLLWLVYALAKGAAPLAAANAATFAMIAALGLLKARGEAGAP